MDRWARDWDCCQGCGTTERKHSVKGYCKRCDGKKRYREKHGLSLDNLNINLRHSPEFKTKRKEIMKKQWQDPNSIYNTPEYKAKQIEIQKITHNTPEYKARRSKIMKAEWQDSEIKEKILRAKAQACKFSNTNIEQQLYKILISIFNEQDIEKQYYVKGLGLAPVDFYIKSYDLYIEVDSKYWHSKLEQIFRDNQKASTLKANGHRCIRILESELNNLDSIGKKIRKELNRKI